MGLLSILVLKSSKTRVFVDLSPPARMIDLAAVDAVDAASSLERDVVRCGECGCCARKQGKTSRVRRTLAPLQRRSIWHEWT